MTQVIKEIFDVLVERKQIKNGVRKAHRVVKIKKEESKRADGGCLGSKRR